jgi:hypothetical protein
VSRATGETETTQENIQDWLQLDEGDPGFPLLTEEEIAAVIFFFFRSWTYIIKFSSYLSKFFFFFCLSTAIFDSLIRMPCPPNPIKPDCRGYAPDS